MFLSDFPQMKNGRNPVRRFGGSLAERSEREIARCYCDNFVKLLGKGLASDLRRPKPLAAT
ncbi:MAG: hypothetical protein WDM86_15550 [Rhizomicrobium sp.]